ncbi:YkgJ family cysteine cluster protein [Chachezhania sediminis]|uniref:YkgJ family cysteine cluster protein n=1 Tax=Chachezhania sediminis TaxID=2599291 RepID=UPI00131BC968|nr:YkgJ family cysteine cluster protein [Chachezhania sediminis]
MNRKPAGAPTTRRRKGSVGTVADLRARLGRARARGMPRALEDRGRRILDDWLAAEDRRGRPVAQVVQDLTAGEAARLLAATTEAQIRAGNPPELAHAVCSAGCAFCCIMLEGDGGLITEAEALAVHAALAPLAGQPDGRTWTPLACAALDPASRMCRAYDARPTVCRSFLSSDVDACRINAVGGDADGSGLLGNHLDYLAILALSRDLLKDVAKVRTYALDRLAIAAVEGLAAGAALAAARHSTAELAETCEDIGGSAV